ncbi:MAG TPA: hypothetical protein PKM25_19055, partial [Candidatus Ozemobacteraceae bacterium]|nr:hypothetical protein [Candidatus Ozemobacteraceae bacterium]
STDRLETLAAELKTAQTAYEKAVRGGSNAPSAVSDAAAATPDESLGEPSAGGSDTEQATAPESLATKRLSAERQSFENLLVKLYGPERKTNPTGLVDQLGKFMEGIFEPQLKIDATWELSELLMESTGSAEQAKKPLVQLAATTRDPEIRRQALARVKQYDVESKIGTQRKAFDVKRQASIAAWQATTKTSWLAFPVKAARWTKWLWADGGRRVEAVKLRKLLDTYEDVVAETYARGTLDEKTCSVLIPANSVTMLVNGRSSFAKRFELVGAAKSSICIQTLLWNDDPIGNKMADMLIDRVKDGVDVRVIIDDAFAFSRRKGIVRPATRRAGVTFTSPSAATNLSTQDMNRRCTTEGVGSLARRVARSGWEEKGDRTRAPERRGWLLGLSQGARRAEARVEPAAQVGRGLAPLVGFHEAHDLLARDRGG